MKRIKDMLEVFRKRVFNIILSKANKDRGLELLDKLDKNA